MSKINDTKKEIAKIVFDLWEIGDDFPTRDLLRTYIYESTLISEFKTHANMKTWLKNNYKKEWDKLSKRDEDRSTKAIILEKVLRLTLEKSRYPTRAEVVSAGICTEGVFDHQFTKTSDYIKALKDTYPYELSSLISSDAFDHIHTKKVKKEIKEYTRFFVTTAVASCAVDIDAFLDLKAMCEKCNILPLFLPQGDPAHQRQGQALFFDKILKDELFVYDEIYLNKSIYISNIMISAKQIKPLTGLRRIGPRIGACLIASPKQDEEPVGNLFDYPKSVMSVGAITEPDYSSGMYMSNRTGYLAKKDHIIGGVLVEIRSDKIFYARHMEYNKDKGGWIDLGNIYNQKTTKKVQVERLVIADMHGHELSPVYEEVIHKAIDKFKPKELIAHDVFNGTFCNPWNRHDKIANATELMTGVEEIQDLGRKLKRFADKVDKFIVPWANHNERIELEIKRGKYPDDRLNFELMHELALYKFRCEKADKNCCLLQYALENYSEEFKTVKNKFVWLQAHDSYKPRRHDFGQHGHLTIQGKKNPSPEELMETLGPCVVGHKHGVWRRLRAYIIGTGTETGKSRPRYARKGPSVWQQAFAVEYETGDLQVFKVIEGAAYID